MKRITWLVLPLVGLLACAGESEPPDTTRSVVLMSDPYEADQVYRSMMGPKGVLHFAFSRQGDPKLLWITGFEAEIVNASDGSAVSPEFMCHSNLDYADKKATRS